MAIFDFWRKRESTAQHAKDRLQIVVARERASTGDRVQSYLPQLQQELLQVIAKYEKLDLEHVSGLGAVDEQWARERVRQPVVEACAVGVRARAAARSCRWR